MHLKEKEREREKEKGEKGPMLLPLFLHDQPASQPVILIYYISASTQQQRKSNVLYLGPS